MKRLFFIKIVLIGLAVFAFALFAFFAVRQHTPTESQKPITVGIIQYLPLLDPVVQGFKQGMEELGYTEGENIIYLYQSAEGNREHIKSITLSYLARDVNLIYAVTSVAAKTALQETQKYEGHAVPIVYAHADNPVETGLAQTLQRPQVNATGVAVDLTELTAKKLQFLQEINPKITKLGIFTSTYSDQAAALALAELRRQVPRFGIELVPYHITAPPGSLAVIEVTQTLNNITTGDIDAFFHTPGPVISQQENIAAFINLGKRLRIPTVFLSAPSVQQGGLFSYSQDFASIGKQSSFIAQKVLQGQQPSVIPIEFPYDNILAINFETAKEIGITIPESMLTLVTEKIGENANQ